MKPTLWLNLLLMLVVAVPACDPDVVYVYDVTVKTRVVYLPPEELPDDAVYSEIAPPEDLVDEPDLEVVVPQEVDVKPDEPDVPTTECEKPLSIKIVLDDEILSGMSQIDAMVQGGCGAVMGAEFYVDAVSIYTDLIPPYNATVNTTGFPDGPHFLTVFTADTSGQVANASTSVVFDNTPPQILETIPVDGATLFFEDGPMHMAVTVDDPMAIQSAEFRANGMLAAEFVVPPFSTELDYSIIFIDLAALPKQIYVQFKVTDYLGQTSEKAINVDVYGRLSWMFSTVGEIWGSAGVMSNGNVVFGNSDHKVFCLGPQGNQKWVYSVDQQVIEAPAVDAGSDRVFVGTVNGTVYGLNSSGGQLWTKDLQTPVGGDIIYRNNVVYVAGFNGGLWALNADNGNTNWEANLPSNIMATPAVAADATVYIGCQDNNLYAVKDGSVQWSIPTGGEVWSTPGIALDQTIYFGSNDGWLYAIKADGSTKWVEEVGGQIWGRPWISADGFVYVASTTKYITKYESNFGGMIWETKTEGISTSSPVQGANGTIYFGTTGGKLFALEPEAGEVKWTYQVGNAIHATPVLDGGMLYFGSTDRNFYGLWTVKPQ